MLSARAANVGQRVPQVDGQLPEPGPVQVHPGAPGPGRRHHRGQLAPAGQHEPGVPQRQLQHQRADRLVERGHLLGGRVAWRVRGPHRAETTEQHVRVPLVHHGVASGAGRPVPAGRLGAVAQGDLLGHGAGGEEGDGLGAEQLGDPALQLLDRPALAVEVGHRVVGDGLPDRRELLPNGRRPDAGEHGVAAVLGREPAYQLRALVGNASSFNRRSRVTASVSTSGRLQKANRTRRRPASVSS